MERLPPARLAVRLGLVTLRHFRNLADQEIEVPPEGVALIGANAQGKSNFLEALYYLETFRSFRGARDDQLVRFGEDVFRVTATLHAEGPASGEADRPVGTEAGAAGAGSVTAAFQKQGRRKKVTVDGVEPDRLGDALGRLGAVIFSPSDVAIVSEGPVERRRFLDIVLSLNRDGYLEALQRYRHVLAQRNASLREDAPAALLRAWDEPLVRDGARVMTERADWVERWTEAFRGFYETVSGGRPAGMTYRPNVSVEGPWSREAAERALREALERTGDSERRMRTTMVGPQRDDLVLSLEGDERGLDVRDFGSGGQRRTAALALRLVEAETIRHARGRAPLVLMDDAFAELDAERSERILELIDREETGQVVLTAPKEADVRLRRESLPRWRIHAGRVEA